MWRWMHYYIVIGCIITSALGCRREHKASPEANPDSRLEAKRQLYCDLSAGLVAERNYVVGKCDGLLFASLRGIACGDGGISEFQNSNGQWFRNREHDCFVPTNVPPNQGADSTISRDMILGAMSHMWFEKNAAQIDSTIAYGKANDWVMGQAKDDATLISKCLLSPNLISVLFDIQSKIAGAASLVRTDESDDALPINTGFRAHLDVVGILLKGDLYGAITDGELGTLKAQAERQPRNALFVASHALYSGGDQSAAMDLLLNGSQFPADRLPTSADSCSDYLWSDDDEPKDWAPCPGSNHQYDGTDFIVAAAVASGHYLKKRE